MGEERREEKGVRDHEINVVSNGVRQCYIDFRIPEEDLQTMMKTVMT